MRVIPITQGSAEWLAWRQGRVVASDAAILCGVSPYVTPYEGYQRKIGEIPEQEANAAMLRGQKDEPIARAMFIDQYDINMTPCCIESDIHPFLGASLDGISALGNYILEIKSTKPVDDIPEMHMYQMQHQLLCTDNMAEMCFYVTIWDNQIHVKEVYPDKEWVKKYLPKVEKFWENVVFKEPPALCPKDYKDRSEVKNWKSYSASYRNICNEIKRLEDLKEEIKQDLINLSEDQNSIGHGIKVLKKTLTGRINYENIPELANLDLEKYRKPSTCTWTIILEK